MFYHWVKGVLSKDDCEKLMREGLAIGFEKAKVNAYGEQKEMLQVRNNDRIEWDAPQVTREIIEKLQGALKEDFPFEFKGLPYSQAATHLRMYRYQPGQYFKPHRDGSFSLSETLESEITVLFYLNTPEGGETVLMPYGAGMKDAFIDIKPEQGDVLIFEHHIWHEGRPVTVGEKWVLRTDLFYDQTALLNQPK